MVCDVFRRTMTENPHEHLVRAIFGRPERAAAELRTLFPQTLLERLDLDTLALVSGSFVDETLRDREADLLFTVRSSGGHAGFVYLLFEHQSTFDRWLPLRLLEYQLRIWERWRRDHPAARRLPRILPVVLFHGDRAWASSTRFEALLDDWDDDGTADDLSLDFGFILDDLTQSSDDLLRSRAMDAISIVTLLALKHARTAQDLQERLLSWASLMSEAARAPGGRDALLLVLRYLALVSDRMKPAFLDKLLPVLDVEVREMTMTLAEMLKEQGRMEEKRRMLLRQLQKRFGELPPSIAQRIADAKIEELDAWAMSILDVRSLEEMFAS